MMGPPYAGRMADIPQLDALVPYGSAKPVAKAFRQPFENVGGGNCLAPFGLGDALVELRALVGRHALVKRTGLRRLGKALDKRPLLGRRKGFEQFDDTCLCLGHTPAL